MDSFIGWIGGKKALRDVIISNFPAEPPKRYVEVFGGAGWVLFRKDKVSGQFEVFNDIDSNLINLYRCIKYHPEALAKELDYILTSREIFYDYKNQLQTCGLTDIQRAARYLYLVKISFGCKKETFATRPKRVDSAVDRFDEIQKRLLGVLIENREFGEIIKLYDSQDTLFYLDPPYHTTEKYYKGVDGVFFCADDHMRLKECLDNIKGKFILSYNDNEFIRKLYSNYNITGAIRNNTLASNSTNEKRFKELIIKNYE
ncbi:MAG: DNA adenine methylase [Candidatus Metalachnospira sp.]|nr:DNA adenine methylase [Candidatus Metalachnospira sp.]